MSKHQQRVAPPPTLEHLLQRLKITSWHYVLVSDGSGTTWDQPGGWGSILIQNQPPTRRSFFGSDSAATNITAELQGIIKPLAWLMEQPETRHRAFTKVVAITDCQYLAKTWTSRGPFKAHRPWWRMLCAMKEQGLQLDVRWFRRDILRTNQFCHELANSSRRTLTSGDLSQTALTKVGAEKLSQLEPRRKRTSV